MSSSVIEIREARARSARVNEEALTVDLANGRTVIVPLAWRPRLWHGTPVERNRPELFGDGSYIYSPDLDEDLAVVDLVAGRRSGESAQSLKHWLVQRERRRRPRSRLPA